jgi:hypothetical protein
MSAYFAGGIWAIWYGLLWVAVVPFVVMVAWVMVRVTPATAGEESTPLNGAVLGALLLMLFTSLASTLLFARAQPSRTIWTYARWIGFHFVVWVFLGSGVLFASLQALAAGPRLRGRRLAAFAALCGALLIHAATLLATWTYRIR